MNIFLSGFVQGVGVRADIYDIALRIGIFGWVRNNPDGRVEILAEGDPGKLDEFILKLKKINNPRAKIENVELTTTQIAVSSHKDFRVIY